MEHDSCPQGHHIITLTIIVGGISSVCVGGGGGMEVVGLGGSGEGQFC